MVKEMANNECIQDVYNRFKERGFPYYSSDKKWRDDKFNVLMNTKLETIIDRRQNIIGQNPNGLSLIKRLSTDAINFSLKFSKTTSSLLSVINGL